MYEHVGLDRLLERGLKGLHQAVWQTPHKADGVGQEQASAGGQGEASGRRVEGREEPVSREHMGTGQPVEERGLARVGVAHDGEGRHWDALALLALSSALPDYLVELAPHAGNFIADATLVHLELGLARVALHRATAALAVEVRPEAAQARQLLLESSQLDLQHCLARLGSGGEDVQDDLLAVNHAKSRCILFPITLLGWRERVIKDD
jgi:hypothetical protein